MHREKKTPWGMQNWQFHCPHAKVSIHQKSAHLGNRNGPHTKVSIHHKLHTLKTFKTAARTIHREIENTNGEFKPGHATMQREIENTNGEFRIRGWGTKTPHAPYIALGSSTARIGEHSPRNEHSDMELCS